MPDDWRAWVPAPVPFKNPLLLEAVLVIALRLEQLNEVRFTIKFLVESAEVSHRQLSLAVSATETRLVDGSSFDFELFDGVDFLFAAAADVASAEIGRDSGRRHCRGWQLRWARQGCVPVSVNPQKQGELGPPA